MTSSNSEANGAEKQALFVEQKSKINEVRGLLGPLSGKSAVYCSDSSIARYLIARNWNVKKAAKMLKESLKWRAEYKPDEICWDQVAHEAETGKTYRASFCDKTGRPVLIMRPGRQNTKSTKGQIQHLVYCMENAILNLPPGQDQMVWLINYEGFNLSHISVKVTKEAAHVLQNHYPERLGIAILYNPPKFFEPFYNMVKPFLEPKTNRKVKFVYSDDQNTKKIMEDLFNMDELESCFGGNNQTTFEINEYGAMMREDDKKMPLFWSPENNTGPAQEYVIPNGSHHSSNSEAELESEEEENRDQAVKQEEDSVKLSGNNSTA